MAKFFILLLIGAIYFGERSEGRPFLGEEPSDFEAISPAILGLLKQTEPFLIADNTNFVVVALLVIGGKESKVNKKATIMYGPNKIIIDTTTTLGSLEINADNETQEKKLTADDFKLVANIGTLTIHSTNFDTWTRLLTQWKDSLEHLRFIREDSNLPLFALTNYLQRQPFADHPYKLKTVEVSVVQTHQQNQVAVKNEMAFLAKNLPTTVQSISFTQPQNSDSATISFATTFCPSGWNAFHNKCTIGCSR